MKEISNNDLLLFFKKFLPYKIKNPVVCNSKELFEQCFDDQKLAEEYYNKFILIKNAYYGHGSELSPFSKDFAGYKNLSNEEKEIKVKEISEKNSEILISSGKCNTRLEFYTIQGYSEEEAKKLLSERQTTFSLEKCIEKYGEEDGRKRWQDRQEKWQNNLKSKSPEELKRINRLKSMNSGYSVSTAEKEILSLLNLDEECHSQIIISDKIPYIYDIVVGKKIIEYNGDYWHANPKIYNESFFNKSCNKTAVQLWQKDKTKHDFARENGYELLVIWERDYINNKAETIQKCLDFLKND